MLKRGRPFGPGNKFGRGRPRGSRNRRSLMAQQLLDQHGEALVRKALVQALQGDSQLLRMFLDRILPRVKDLPVKTGSLRMGTTDELLQAHETLMKKVASGQLTPGQALEINALIESRSRLIERQELEMRVHALEQLHRKDQDKAA